MRHWVCQASLHGTEGLLIQSTGPTTYYNWMLSASTITSTMSLPLGKNNEGVMMVPLD